MAAARAIAAIVAEDELREDYIIPSVFNRDVAPAVADAVAERPRGAAAPPAAASDDRLRGRSTRSDVRRAERRRPERRAWPRRAPRPYPAHEASRVTGRHRPDRPPPRRARCASAATRSPCSRATPTRARRRSARRGRRLGPDGRARAGRRAGRPRRRRPPRRRARRPALDRDGQAARSATAARLGTRNLVAGLRARRARARACSSRRRPSATTAPHGDERVDEATPPGDDFLAARLRRLGARGERRRGARPARRRACAPASCSTARGGALAKMLPPFRLGVGGPVAGGRQYMPWIHVDDLVGLYLAAARRRRRGRGPVNAHGARAGHQPRVLARRSAARCTARRSRRSRRSRCGLLYGEMAEIVTDGPARRARARRSSSATPSRTRSSTRRCARRAARAAPSASRGGRPRAALRHAAPGAASSGESGSRAGMTAR